MTASYCPATDDPDPDPVGPELFAMLERELDDVEAGAGRVHDLHCGRVALRWPGPCDCVLPDNVRMWVAMCRRLLGVHFPVPLVSSSPTGREVRGWRCAECESTRDTVTRWPCEVPLMVATLLDRRRSGGVDRPWHWRPCLTQIEEGD